MAKRILFLIPDLMHGGAEKVLVNLVNNLDRSKYDITLFSLFDCGVNKDYLDAGINYRYKFKIKLRGNSHFFKLFSPKFLYQWIITDEYDIAIAYLEGVAARIISGCPTPTTKKVAWLHTEIRNESLLKTSFRSFYEAVNCYKQCDRIIGVSKDIAESFRRRVSRSLPVEVLYNVNDTEEILLKARGGVEDEHYVGSEISICSVGKIVSVKGYDRLLEAHHRLIVEGLQHHVYIIGCGEGQKKLERRAAELGVADSFKFLGFHKNPYKYISQCGLYVCSSRREGFSTAVTEALVLGLPVVSTDCSGAKELLGENDEFGLVVENSTEGVYQGMKRMLSEPGLLEYYREQSAIRGQRFSKMKTVKAVEDMLDSM